MLDINLLRIEHIFRRISENMYKHLLQKTFFTLSLLCCSYSFCKQTIRVEAISFPNFPFALISVFELVHTGKPHICNCHKNTTESICQTYIWIRGGAHTHSDIRHRWGCVFWNHISVVYAVAYFSISSLSHINLTVIVLSCPVKTNEKIQRFKHLHIF